MPRKRLGLAACKASSTGRTLSPRFRFACPTMDAAALVGPYSPVSLAAARPCTNSTSPTGRSSSGPPGRYMERGLNKHRGAYVVAAVNIVGQFVEQVALKGNTLRAIVPEVVVGVADGYLGFQCFLGVKASQSFPPNGISGPPVKF